MIPTERLQETCAGAIESILLVATMKFFTTGELAPLRYAMPKIRAGGAGMSGRTFKLRPANQVRSCGTRATPRPASADAMTLVALSYSSAIRGASFSGANKPASQARYSG